MTTDKFRALLLKEFDNLPYPSTYEVDHETYANVCQSVFNWLVENEHGELFSTKAWEFITQLVLGPHNGIMFKNIELILKDK